MQIFHSLQEQVISFIYFIILIIFFKSRVLLETLLVVQLFKEFPAFMNL
jgi:hypothetical protein